MPQAVVLGRELDMHFYCCTSEQLIRRRNATQHTKLRKETRKMDSISICGGNVRIKFNTMCIKYIIFITIYCGFSFIAYMYRFPFYDLIGDVKINVNYVSQ